MEVSLIKRVLTILERTVSELATIAQEIRDEAISADKEAYKIKLSEKARGRKREDSN